MKKITELTDRAVKELADEYKKEMKIEGNLAYKHNGKIVFPVEFLKWVVCKSLIEITNIRDANHEEKSDKQ